MAGELIIDDYQIDFNGLLLGAGTAYDLVKLDGWEDLPGLANGGAARSARHGSWAGRLRGQSRTVTATIEVAAGESSMADVVRTLRAGTRVYRGADPAPLAIRYDGDTKLAWAQTIGRIIPVDLSYSLGLVPTATVQWWCADPRRYDLAEQTLTITAPTAGSGGLTYSLAYPLDYGTAGSPANGTVTNNGDVETNPVIVLTGPITTPRITNSTLTRVLEFDIDLLAGQTLTIDTDAGTVLLNEVTDRLYTRTNLSVPVEYFELDPGDNDITLLASAFGDGAQMVITWRSAYL